MLYVSGFPGSGKVRIFSSRICSSSENCVRKVESHSVVLIRHKSADDFWQGGTLILLRVCRNIFYQESAQNRRVRVPMVVIDIESSAKTIAVIATRTHSCRSTVKMLWNEKERSSVYPHDQSVLQDSTVCQNWCLQIVPSQLTGHQRYISLTAVCMKVHNRSTSSYGRRSRITIISRLENAAGTHQWPSKLVQLLPNYF